MRTRTFRSIVPAVFLMLGVTALPIAAQGVSGKAAKKPSKPAATAVVPSAPAKTTATAPQGAPPSSGVALVGTVSATCKDGSSFKGNSRQGACSGHGGVKAWGDGAAASRPKGATAQCNDGSWYEKAERKGACSGHGGVKSWVKP